MAEVDVLVAGAGPTGSVMAAELLRRGVKVRVIDKAATPSPLSRAIGVQARTLEILDDLGVGDELIAKGTRVTGMMMRAGGHSVVTVDFGELETRYPFVLCVPQADTEAVLAGLVQRRGGAIERGCELVSLAQDATGVDAVLRTSAGEERVRAKWLIGCDGAHSTVRHAIGAQFDGRAYEDTFVLADVQLAWDAPADRAATFFAEDGIVACFPLPGGRWRVIATAPASLTEPTLDDVRALIAPRIAMSIALSDPKWIAPFRIHCRQVASYRHRRVLLAGDAAHVHSPVGGQGMNTGIQDAHNLGWKLALVITGKAREELIDSYHAERHAVGRHVLAVTDIATKIGMLKGLAAPIRNHAIKFITSFEPVRTFLARDVAELDVGYTDSPIVAENVGSLIGARWGRVEAAETPNLGSHRAFAAGPKPGERAPDGPATLDGRSVLLSQLGRGDGFTLLLFDGRSSTAEGYDALVEIAQAATKRGIASYIVVRGEARPPQVPAAIKVLLDAGELEECYGAASECLYLVRPDLYVGFRSQPAHGEALDAYLSELLV